jgi:hypothetical protein
MRTTMSNFATVSTWIRYGVLSLAVAVPCVSLSVGCSQAEGSRCNPALSHDECDNAPTVQCLGPSYTEYPACNSEAYCCAVDLHGNITSMEPNCQFLIMCQASANADGGTTPDADTTPETGAAPADASGDGS